MSKYGHDNEQTKSNRAILEAVKFVKESMKWNIGHKMKNVVLFCGRRRLKEKRALPLVEKKWHAVGIAVPQTSKRNCVLSE